MLDWNLSQGWQFSHLFIVLVVAAIVFAIWRNRARRNSLHRRDDGWYVWTEWHGGERTSLKDPSETGGDWDSGDGGGSGGGGGS